MGWAEGHWSQVVTATMVSVVQILLFRVWLGGCGTWLWTEHNSNSSLVHQL